MKATHGISFILVVVGALNWLLIGLGGWNVVNMLLGAWSWLERLVYILVGLAGVYLLCTHKKTCKCCEKGDSMSSMPSSAPKMM